MALQLTATSGPSDRWLLACNARAANSLPVPDSPRIKTGAMLRATLAMRSRTSVMACELPTSRAKDWLACREGVEGATGWPVANGTGFDLAASAGAIVCVPAARNAADAITRRNCFRSTGLVR